jgi:GNAT superfamily N-acetyltransferase
MSEVIEIIPVDISVYSEEIQRLGDDAFGEGYITPFLSASDSLICIGAFCKRELVGFIISYIVDFNILKDIDLKYQLKDCCQIAFLKSIVVKPSYRRLSIASRMIGLLREIVQQQSVYAIYAEAWETPNGITSGPLFTKAGFSFLKRMPAYWFNDSIERNYKCSECGHVPCCCDAVIFYQTFKV